MFKLANSKENKAFTKVLCREWLAKQGLKLYDPTVVVLPKGSVEFRLSSVSC